MNPQHNTRQPFRDTILDCHTHRISEGAIVCVDPPQLDATLSLHPGIRFSTGIHPWRLESMTDEEFEREMRIILRNATLPNAAAIGETGLDALRGGDLERQRKALMRHVEASEKMHLPLILHAVRTGHEIIRLRKQLHGNISQPWIWHGFRGNPVQAAQFCSMQDCYISLGARFNPSTAANMTTDRLLTETDAADENIEEIIRKVAETRRCLPGEIMESVATNTRRIFRSTSSAGTTPDSNPY